MQDAYLLLIAAVTWFCFRRSKLHLPDFVKTTTTKQQQQQSPPPKINNKQTNNANQNKNKAKNTNEQKTAIHTLVNRNLNIVNSDLDNPKQMIAKLERALLETKGSRFKPSISFFLFLSVYFIRYYDWLLRFYVCHAAMRPVGDFLWIGASSGSTYGVKPAACSHVMTMFDSTV